MASVEEELEQPVSPLELFFDLVFVFAITQVSALLHHHHDWAGVARALVKFDPTTEGSLRQGGYLTRDSRMKERKKYGQRGARRRFQFSKR